jgi:phage/plasmid-associated DNA primase
VNEEATFMSGEGGVHVGSSLGRWFTPEEELRFVVEEELRKDRDRLGGDYSLLRDLALKIRVGKEAGFVHIFYEGAKVYEIEDTAFAKSLGIAVENLLYRTGLATRLKDVSKCVEALSQAIFRAKKFVEDAELQLLRLQPFDERLRRVVEEAPRLVQEVLARSTEYGDVESFEKLKAEAKASVVFRVLEAVFDFVRVWPREVTGSSEYYVLDENVLREVDEVVEPVVGALIKNAVSKRVLIGEVKTAVKSTTKFITWEQVDPWDRLNLRYEVLDLRTLRLTTNQGHYFRYRLPLVIRQDEIDEVKEGHYDIKCNEVYKLWRRHFDDENWEYLIHSLGTWLAPHRSRHIAFIIGPRGSGKSTLLKALTNSIEPIVSNISLNLLTSYTFGLEGLIGKQINVYSERGDVVLKRIDLINNLVGEHDYIAVPRKYKQTTTMRSLKAMCFAMNDLPIVTEYGGETMMAFLDRLSIIQMRAPEDFKPIPDLRVDRKEAFLFLLWCRCRLEESGWKIKKMDEDAMLDLLMKASSSALRFLESEWVIKDPSAKVEGTELYEAYMAWCREQGITPMGRNNFYSTVATEHVKRVEMGRTWFRGIMLNPKMRSRAERTIDDYR